jgi:magnesium-transporting ATPase (P-type)
MIPISLFVTIEISRLTQALFMYSDNEMMSSTGQRMRPNNSNLNEDLGRVRSHRRRRTRMRPHTH